MGHTVKKFYRMVAALLSFLMFSLLTVLLLLQAALPDRYYLAQGEPVTGRLANLPGIVAGGLAEQLPTEVVSQAGNEFLMRLSLPGGAVIKTVNVQVIARSMVVPAGTPFGIKMFTDGVMVVGMSDLDFGGKAVNPAKSAGIRTGDIILSIDGTKMAFNEDVGRVVSASEGRQLGVVIQRDGEQKNLTLTPVRSPVDDIYRAGIWVRDSSAGIGTMTYYDPASGLFAGLGHAICDVDTGALMPLSSGEAVEVTITGVNKAASGAPGELRGVFGNGRSIGELVKNDQTGIYGYAGAAPVSHAAVPMATRSEVQPGAATIYTTLDGKQPQSYQIEIERIAAGDANPTKNMVIRVTDPKLIEKTGGIVQGMSGSPILQNGKLVGAVTHVFVNDPTRGYAIFAQNMRCEGADQTTANLLAA